MQVQSSECESENANALKRSDPGCELSGADDPKVCPGHAKDEREVTRKEQGAKMQVGGMEAQNAKWKNFGGV